METAMLKIFHSRKTDRFDIIQILKILFAVYDNSRAKKKKKITRNISFETLQRSLL